LLGLQEVLEATKGSVDSAEEAMQVVAGEATLAIMKAKLTALQGGNDGLHEKDVHGDVVRT
jgi:hypothetical protein